MIKLVFCLRKIPSFSLEQFQDYWYNQHAPLVRKHGDVLGIRRYVQVHTLATPLNDAIQESRGGPTAYDGVAELWYDSLDAIMAATQSPEGLEAAAALLEDEKKFIDLAQSPLWLANERPIIEG